MSLSLQSHSSPTQARICHMFWVLRTAACVEGYSLDSVYDYVEAMMMNMEPITATLRMLALISLCNGGIPRKTFDALRREFLHVRRLIYFLQFS